MNTADNWNGGRRGWMDMGTDTTLADIYNSGNMNTRG